MQQSEFNIKSRPELFRVKHMNAVEFMAMRSIADTDRYDASIHFFNIVLSKIEVKVGQAWLPVKNEHYETFCPTDLADDYDGVHDLVEYFVENVLKPVFKKSVESNKSHLQDPTD